VTRALASSGAMMVLCSVSDERETRCLGEESGTVLFRWAVSSDRGGMAPSASGGDRGRSSFRGKVTSSMMAAGMGCRGTEAWPWSRGLTC